MSHIIDPNVFVHSLDYIGQDFYKSDLWEGYEFEEEFLDFEGLEIYQELAYIDLCCGIELLADRIGKTDQFKLSTIFFYLTKVDFEDGEPFTGILPDKVSKNSSSKDIIERYGEPSRRGEPYTLLGQKYGSWMGFFFNEKQYHFLFQLDQDKLEHMSVSWKIPE